MNWKKNPRIHFQKRDLNLYFFSLPICCHFQSESCWSQMDILVITVAHNPFARNNFFFQSLLSWSNPILTDFFKVCCHGPFITIVKPGQENICHFNDRTFYLRRNILKSNCPWCSQFKIDSVVIRDKVSILKTWWCKYTHINKRRFQVIM